MSTCWTCGSQVAGDSYTCLACASLDVLTGLAQLATNQGANTNAGLAHLARVQRQGFAQLQATLSRGFSQLANAIEWGFSELAWQIQQQSEVLKGIDQTLKTPSETQANEYRLMADELKRRGVLDEAEEFYRKALALNRLDYRIYVGLAHTCLETNQFAQAYQVLERSLPHAPKGGAAIESGISDWKSYSLRLIGHIQACREEWANAAASLLTAVELSPLYAEALFDHAQYAAQVGDLSGCLASLEKAIMLEPLYWSLTRRQRTFRPVASALKSLLHSLREATRREAYQAIESCERKAAGLRADVSEHERATKGLTRWLWAEPKEKLTAARQSMQASLAEINRDIGALMVLAESDDYDELLGIRGKALEVERRIAEASAALSAWTRELSSARADHFLHLSLLIGVLIGFGILILAVLFSISPNRH